MLDVKGYNRKYFSRFAVSTALHCTALHSTAQHCKQCERSSVLRSTAT